MKDYKFYKNDYLVFSDGRVYSFKSHRYLKPSFNAYGYLKLKINGIKARSKSVVYNGKVFNSGAELCRKLGVERHAASLAIRHNTRLKGHYVQFGNEVRNGI